MSHTFSHIHLIPLKKNNCWFVFPNFINISENIWLYSKLLRVCIKTNKQTNKTKSHILSCLYINKWPCSLMGGGCLFFVRMWIGNISLAISICPLVLLWPTLVVHWDSWSSVMGNITKGISLNPRPLPLPFMTHMDTHTHPPRYCSVVLMEISLFCQMN